MDQIAQYISMLGFPIVCCGALFWYMVKESREMREVVNNNSTILLRILEHFKKEDE